MLELKKKKLVRFVSYPGSGTHMLIDILNVMKINHLPIYDLLFKIFQLANGASKNDIINNVNRKKIFLKIVNEINFQQFSRDFSNIFNIIDETIFRKIKNDYYIIKPDLDYELPEMVSFCEKFFNFKSKYVDLKNIAYIRHPKSILISKTNRFLKIEDNFVDNEVKRINDFFMFNKYLIEKYNIKYEYLCNDFKNEIKKLYKIYEIDQKLIVNNFKIYKSKSIPDFSRSSRDFEKLSYLNNIYKYEIQKTPLSSKLTNYVNLNLNQIKVIFHFIICDNLMNDAYFNRTRRLFVPKVILYILLLINPLKKKYIANMKKVLKYKEKTFYI